MSSLAQEIDEHLRQLDPETAGRVKCLIREVLSSAARKTESVAPKRPLVFPLIQGTPGMIINPTKEQL